MKKYAVVYEDEVVNMIMWDGKTPYECLGELILNEDNLLKIGMYKVGDVWHEPPVDDIEPEPEEQ